jgi:hypothetical protein
MTEDLGVWTADHCALVLIDYQREMFEVTRSETSGDLVEMHVRLCPGLPRCSTCSSPCSSGSRSP